MGCELWRSRTSTEVASKMTLSLSVLSIIGTVRVLEYKCVPIWMAAPLIVSFRTEELCEGRGGRPGLPVPNSPYDLCGRKATLEEEASQFQSSGTV